MKQTLPLLITLCLTLSTYAQQSQVKLAKCTFYFDSGKKLPDNASVQRLDSIINLLSQYDVMKLSLSGYADSIGDSLINLKLSARRTDTIYNLLLKNGVNPKIVKLEANGENQPAADNSIEQGRKQNRRVTLVAAYQPRDNNNSFEVDTFRVGRKRKKDVINCGTIWCDTCTFRLFCITTPPRPCERIDFKPPHGTLINICRTDYESHMQCGLWTEYYPKGEKGFAGLTVDLCYERTKEPIEILIPSPQKSNLYTMGAKGWQRTSTTIIKRGGSTYLRAYIDTGKVFARFNQGSPNNYVIKLKNRTHQRITGVELLVTGSVYIPFKKRNRNTFTVNAPRLYTAPEIYVTIAGNPQGHIALSTVKGKGEVDGVDAKGGIEFNYKKKYILRKTDLENKPAKPVTTDGGGDSVRL